MYPSCYLILTDLHAAIQTPIVADLDSLNPRTDAAFNDSKEAQQFKTERDRASDHSPFSDEDQQFFRLWLEQPSWSPILLNQHGWQTAVNHTGKKVPLNLKTIESYYRRHIVLGKRFSKLTNYLLIDIDTGSPYHPNNGSIQPVLDAMESLGLCRYLLIRSSTSEGLHIYFPLNESVSSWGLACLADAALAAHGITVAAGQCELFPSKKALNSEYNGHRLPLQDGSFLLDNDFCPFSNHFADFLQDWRLASNYQDNETLLRALKTKAVPVPVADTHVTPSATTPQVHRRPGSVTEPVLPPIGWSQYSQSNDILRQLVNYGDRYVGLKTIDDLAAWVKAVAPQLHGYEEFASPKSKKDIEFGTWPRRWATSHFRSAWSFKVGGSNHNAEVAADAKRRIFAALDLVCVDVDIAITTLYRIVSELSKVWFGLGFGPSTFKKYRAEIRAYIKRAGEVGLSRDISEDVNSLSSEPGIPENTGLELRPKNFYSQLLTIRCVLSAYSRVFDDVHTCKKEVKNRGGVHPEIATNQPQKSAVIEAALIAAADSAMKVAKTDEKEGKEPVPNKTGLTIGQRVRIAMPGGSLDGIETQVIAQTRNVLGQPVYQLAYQRQGQAISLPAECLQVVEAKPLLGEAVIRATAAQLLQVLGKACPFVGPGLWPVRRSEVTSRVWNSLKRLIESEKGIGKMSIVWDNEERG